MMTTAPPSMNTGSWIVRRAVLAAALLVSTVAAATPGNPAVTPTTISLEQAHAILTESDRYRGGLAHGGQWTVELESKEGDVSRSLRYEVKARGTNALVQCTAPARNSGEVMLFQERSLWYYKGGLRRPIPLSPRQRLVGQAANGDIAATNYARDYDVTAVTDDTTDGQPSWRMELKAKSKSVTYDRIRYWIRKRDRLGVVAEFLTLQGEVFKRATFEYANRLMIGDQQLPFISKMAIVSATFASEITVLTYRNPSARSLDESMFNVNNLLR